LLLFYRDFEAEQKIKQSSIMGKILVEEERMKRRKKQQPVLWPDPKKEKSKVATVKPALATTCL